MFKLIRNGILAWVASELVTSYLQQLQKREFRYGYAMPQKGDEAFERIWDSGYEEGRNDPYPPEEWTDEQLQGWVAQINTELAARQLA